MPWRLPYFVSLNADVVVYRPSSPDEVREVEDAFVSLGLTATARTATRRGLGEAGWMVLAALPLQAFLQSLVSEAASDTYRKLRDLVTRVFEPRAESKRGPAVLVLQDAASGVQIALDSDLPPEAYEELVALDLSAFECGPVHYDRVQKRWRSELDEWKQQRP